MQNAAVLRDGRPIPSERPVPDEDIHTCLIQPAQSTHGDLTCPPAGNMAKHTQANLVRACKRFRVSTSGSKSALMDRLSRAGLTTDVALSTASADWERLREPISLVGDRRERRGPNWTKHETARLCHVVADPRNSIALRKLYERDTNRSEIESGRHDPWSNEFMELFNDPAYEPQVPEISGGAVQELLEKF
jgi:hypothetical protein